MEPLNNEQFEEDLAVLLKKLTDIVTAQKPTPLSATVTMFALCHVLVALVYTVSEDDDKKAIEMLANVLVKTVTRRKNALKPDEKPKTETT